MSDEKNYGFGAEDAEKTIPAPKLAYQPGVPKTYRPKIGLIGCGGITEQHLTAYRKAHYDVIALCDIDRSRAEDRAKEFYPEAKIFESVEEILKVEEIDVIDAATHPAARVDVIEASLKAGKHVLSQKPFCMDLDTGEKLVALAEAEGRKLAVNHNGRYAPHWSYIREAVAAGLIGPVSSVHCESDWDHNWVVGTPFDRIHHLLLYDFAIHWFDFVTCIFGFKSAKQVTASIARSATQDAQPPLLGQIGIEYEGATAALSFNGNTRQGGEDRTTVIGDAATLRSSGPNLNTQAVTMVTGEGVCRPDLEGQWVPDGFRGTMGELLCAIEEDREPANCARTNLVSLELAFAAIASADSGLPVDVGSVRRIEKGCSPE